MADKPKSIHSAGIKCPFCTGVFVITAAQGVESHSDPPCHEYTAYQPQGTFLDRAGLKAGWKRGSAHDDDPDETA